MNTSNPLGNGLLLALKKAIYAFLISVVVLEVLSHCKCLFFTEMLRSSDSLYGILITAAFIITLWYKRLDYKEQELENEKARISTEKFQSAIELLGHQDPCTRIGAIYTLGRLMEEDKEMHWPVVEMLSDYIRTRAPIPLDNTDKKSPPRDIEAAIRVLGRRKTELDPKDSKIDINHSNLNKITFSEHAKFSFASFHGSTLKHANMMEAELSNASFYSTDLTGATLSGANLFNANFNKAILKDTIFSCRDKHTGIPAIPAHLCGADFTGAKEIDSANFKGAKYNDKTKGLEKYKDKMEKCLNCK